MGAIARFLVALERLARKSGLKIEDAYKFAKQEFGELTPLLKKQIQNVFDKIKKPAVGKPGKKEGTVLPLVRDAKKVEGIETLDDFNLSKDDPMGDLEKIVKGEGDTGLPKDAQTKKLDELMNFFRQEIEKADAPKLDSKENIQLGIEKLRNPNRPGGPLDPAIGVTRTLARRVLEKRNIEIGKKDPIDVFNDTFGEAIVDLKNLGEEMIEADQTGRQLKPMDDLLEMEGFFDMEIPKNPNKGVPNEDVIEMLEKDLEQKEILEDFDPTFRKPNATGGLTRTSYAMGSDDEGEPIKPDPTKPINPFGPKPTGPVLPDKSVLVSSKTYMDYVRAALELGLKPIRIDEFESLTPIMDVNEILKVTDDLNKRSNKATGGRVQAASGGLADILKV
jgi:hypothetical protein|tara:strand:+ start:349 stop:1521 length:1173 start_codon:yes stop_codon:yes gene_type:complete